VVLISVVIPCFNEERNVARFNSELFPELDALGIDYEVVAIDDGSTDGTARLLSSLRERGQRIKIFSHIKNMGLGAAVRTGIRNASGDLLVTLDADLTFHPRYIRLLIARFYEGNVDCVIGSPALFGYDKSIPAYRRFVSWAGGRIFNLAFGRRVSSPTSIFRLYKTCQLREMDLQTDGFGINAEILALLFHCNRTVAEVAVPLTVRLYGKSNLNYAKEIQRQMLLAARIWRWRRSGSFKRRCDRTF